MPEDALAPVGVKPPKSVRTNTSVIRYSRKELRDQKSTALKFQERILREFAEKKEMNLNMWLVQTAESPEIQARRELQARYYLVVISVRMA